MAIEQTALQIAARLEKDAKRREQWNTYGADFANLSKAENAALERQVDKLLKLGGAALEVVEREPLDLKFEWSEELAESDAAIVDWVFDGMLALRSVSLLYSRPKVGKSTFIGGLLGALTDPGISQFVGRPISTGRAIYLSEEGAATLSHKLPARVRTLSRENSYPKPEWSDLLDAAAAEAAKVAAQLIVVDTFRFWGGLQGDAENSAGQVQPLLDHAAAIAAEHNLSMLIVHHARKGGGEGGDGSAGSNAIVGSPDILLELDRVGEEAPAQRTIIGQSRFLETPGALVYEWDKSANTFALIGEGEDRYAGRRASQMAQIEQALREAGEPLAREDFVALGMKWGPNIQKALESLRASGRVVRSGAGQRGNPYRYEAVQHSNAQDNTESEEFSVRPFRGTETETANSFRSRTETQQADATPLEIEEAERIAAKFGEAV